MDLDRAADELYGLPPGDFVARRTELAREAADKAVAKQIKELRRPTVSAWAVNRFARSEPGLLDTLLKVGENLREAWSTGVDRAEADRARAQAVAAAVRATVSLAERPLPEQVRREIEDTYQAALVDPDAAAELVAARLAAPLSHIGFAFTAPLPPQQTPARKAPQKKAARKKAPGEPPREDPRLLLRRLEVAAAQAEEAATAAEAAVAAEGEKIAALEAEREESTRRLAELTQRLAELAEGLKAARAGLKPAEKSARTARAEADAAARRVAEAREGGS